MEAMLHMRVQVLRFLFRCNDLLERRQEPRAPEPSFMRIIPSPSTTRRVRLSFYTPADFGTSESGVKARYPLIVDFHGGGLVAGSPSMDARWVGTLIATEARPVVVGVDYGLAPENPFPTALQDAAAALLWLATDGVVEYGLDAKHIILVGFSGGGTLALCVPMWMASREDNVPSENEPTLPNDSLVSKLPHPLRGTIAIYPGVDFRLERQSEKSMLGRFMNSTWDDAYFRRSPVDSPFVSPAAASDKLLRIGLPERVALYSVADDALAAPCEDFRKRLAALEKRISGDVEPGVAHAWDKMPMKEGTAEWEKRQAWYQRMASEVEDMLSS